MVGTKAKALIATYEGWVRDKGRKNVFSFLSLSFILLPCGTLPLPCFVCQQQGTVDNNYLLETLEKLRK